MPLPFLLPLLNGPKLGTHQVQLHFVTIKCHFPKAQRGVFVCLLQFDILMTRKGSGGGEAQ